MRLRSGIPLLEEVNELALDELYRQMRSADDMFVDKYGRLVHQATFRWVCRPMRQWSRRWEYPYVAQRVFDLAAKRGARPLKILDAGSGATFFPYYICDGLPDSEVICCDSDKRYVLAFDRLAKAMDNRSVRFVPGMLQDLPLDSDSVDVVTCVSVVEHTGEHERILDEFRRVLRPGGTLILTFDISIDGRTEIPPEAARELLQNVLERFDPSEPFDALAELDRLADPAKLMTTDAARAQEPSLLPWRWPILKSLYDLIRGRGWSGGFFSLACYCLEVRAKEAPAT